MAKLKGMFWNHDRLVLIGSHHNYFVAFKELPHIEAIPIELTCGETLEPGDKFHMAGLEASASTPGLLMIEGGLEYVGKTRLPEITDCSVALLFHWVDDGKRQPLSDLARKYDAKVAYVAFTEIGKNWHYTSSSGSSRLVITNELRRGLAPNSPCANHVSSKRKEQMDLFDDEAA